MDGYKNILYRYDRETDKKSNYTAKEAFDQLHNLDAVFPLYENYFNATPVDNESDLTEILKERIYNIQGHLKALKIMYATENGGVDHHSNHGVLICVGVVSLFLKLIL